MLNLPQLEELSIYQSAVPKDAASVAQFANLENLEILTIQDVNLTSCPLSNPDALCSFWLGNFYPIDADANPADEPSNWQTVANKIPDQLARIGVTPEHMDQVTIYEHTDASSKGSIAIATHLKNFEYLGLTGIHTALFDGDGRLVGVIRNHIENEMDSYIKLGGLCRAGAMLWDPELLKRDGSATSGIHMCSSSRNKTFLNLSDTQDVDLAPFSAVIYPYEKTDAEKFLKGSTILPPEQVNTHILDFIGMKNEKARAELAPQLRELLENSEYP